MKILFRMFCVFCFGIGALAGLAWQFRYQYDTVPDVVMETPIVGNVTLTHSVHRPIRFDRWTGKTEIYIEKDKWADMAEWNQEKSQTMQTTLKELNRIS